MRWTDDMASVVRQIEELRSVGHSSTLKLHITKDGRVHIMAIEAVLYRNGRQQLMVVPVQQGFEGGDDE